MHLQLAMQLVLHFEVEICTEAISSLSKVWGTYSLALKSWETSSATLTRHSLQSWGSLGTRGTWGTSVTLVTEKRWVEMG